MKIWVVVNEFRAQLTMLGIYRGSFKGLDFKVYATIGINRKYLILEKIKLPQLTRTQLHPGQLPRQLSCH